MNAHEVAHGGRPRVWAIGGGKGGTGKSLIAASLGIHFAQMGRRVVLVDADLGAPNLHTFLGLDPPGLSLSDVIRRDAGSLDGIAVETGVPRLRLVSGARNRLDAEGLKHFQKTRLLRLVSELEADLVLVDLGAGTSLNVLDFFSIADRGVVVILPEPTSIENCYRFLQAALLRRLQHLARTLGYQPVVNLVLEQRGRLVPDRPAAILEEIRRVDWCAAREIEGHLDTFRPHLILNQVRDAADARVGHSIRAVSERLLAMRTAVAGFLPYDPVLVRSIKSRRPFLLEYPRSRTAEALRAAAESIRDAPAPGCDRLPGPLQARGPGEAADWEDPHAVLGLSRGATHEQILSAYLRLRSAFRSDSPALVSLDCEAERRSALAQIEEAFRLLSRRLSPPGRCRALDRSATIPPLPHPQLLRA